MKKIFILFLCFSAHFNVYAGTGDSGYSFQENKGQIRDKDGHIRSEVLFTGEADNYTIYLRKSGWSYVIKSYDSTGFDAVRVDVELQNSKIFFNIDTKHKLSGYDNFIMSGSEFIANVNSYLEVVYEGIYEGIDLRFYYDKGNLRYDYIVHPGANPNQILMAIKYSDNPTINQENGINIPTLLGEIRKEKPFAYQFDSTQKVEIPCNYKLSDNKISFNAGIYDKTKELIIDPITLVSAKLNRIKSLYRFNRDPWVPIYYSYSLNYNNVKRLSDNSLFLVTNDVRDKEFIDDAKYLTRRHIRHSERYTDFLPAVIYKYNPEGDKEWSTYIYEKYNFVISWDATDSIAAIYSQSYIFYDSTMRMYNKEAVFVSLFDMKSGLLLNRFELEKPEGIEQLKHTYMDGELFGSMIPDNNSNYYVSILDNGAFQWNINKSYEKVLYLKDSIISLIALGQYPGNNDTVYDYGLILQKYNLGGKLIYNHEIKRNKIYLIANKRQVDFSRSDFGYSSITMDYKTVRFLNDGSFITMNQNMKNKDKFSQNQCSHEAYYNLYDTDGNLIFASEQDNDFRFLFEKYKGGDSLRKIPSEGADWYHPFTIYYIDSSKNIYLTKNLGKNDILWKKYKDRIKVNPYNPNPDKGQPCLMKFDSTGKLLWLSQFLTFPDNYSISNLRSTVGGSYTRFNDNGELESFFDQKLREQFQDYYLDMNDNINHGSQVMFNTTMNTGTELIMSLDSIGNIFIQRFIDSMEYRRHPTSRRLVVTKMSPDGDVIWQDTAALYIKYDNLPTGSRKYQLFEIKSSRIFNHELYLDYFVSNVDEMTYMQDSSKYDIDDFYPIESYTHIHKDWNTIDKFLSTNALFDLITFRFKLDDSKLVSVTPTKVQISDTICVNHETSFKVEVRNEWHSPMEFEPPHLTGEGFRIVPNGAFTLQAGEKKEFTIVFAPKQHKVHTGSVVFKQNTISDFSHTVEFSGVTKAVVIETDLVWDLGTILINNTASGIFRVHNNGDVDSWIQGIKDLPTEFKQITPENTSNFIKAGEYLDYTIEFTPTKAGIFEYIYKIYAGTGCPDTLEILIKGKGVTESIVINADSLDFGYLYFCENKTDTITIENVTNLPLTYNSAQITGLNADNFVILEKPDDGTILVRGNPAKFVIEYKPLSPFGLKDAELEINTSEKAIKCPLKGEFVEINITANNIDFGFRNINVTYDTTVVIKNNSKDLFTLENALPADSRITVKTALPLAIPSMEEKELVLEIKSATTEPVNSKLMLVFSNRCTTEIESNIVCNFDSAKVEISGIDFGKVPYCEDRTDSIVILNTGKVKVKLVNLEFLDNDGRFEFVINEKYPLEIPAESTYSKLIRYLSGKKEKSVNTAKVVITLEIDGIEKTFEIEVTGERIIPELEYLNLIDFGELKPGEEKNTVYEISNIGEEIEITDILIKNPDFKVSYFDKKILGKSKGKINLSFSSDIIGIYETEMTVYFNLGECKDSIEISLKSEVKRLMTIWANHDTVDAGTVGYYVPIYAKTDKGANINGTNYTLNIKYLSEFYNPVTSDDALILSKTKDGLFEQITVSGTFPVFSDSTAILFKLKGDILFTLTKTTPIEIEYLTSEASLLVTTIDGSLTLNPMCIEELRSIKSLIPTTLKVAPNPADGDLKVTVGTQEEGSFSIIIYDFQGREVAKSDFKRSNRTYEEKDYTFNITGLGTGVYSVHLTAPWTLKRERLLIVK